MSTKMNETVITQRKFDKAWAMLNNILIINYIGVS